MATSALDWLQEVSDPTTQRALGALVTAIRTDLQVLYANDAAIDTALKSDAVINPTTLSKGSTPENVATTAFQFRIDGVTATKAAVAAGTAFTGGTINVGATAGFFYGGWVFQVNASGTISALPTTGNQVYTTAAAALAAAQAVTPTTAYVAIGYVVVQTKTGAAWTAGTDDLTPASDCEAVTYTSVPGLALTALTSITLVE